MKLVLIIVTAYLLSKLIYLVIDIEPLLSLGDAEPVAVLMDLGVFLVAYLLAVFIVNTVFKRVDAK